MKPGNFILNFRGGVKLLMVALSFLFASDLFAQITDPVGGGSGRDSLDFDDLDEGIDIDSFYRLWPSVTVKQYESVLYPE